MTSRTENPNQKYFVNVDTSLDVYSSRELEKQIEIQKWMINKQACRTRHSNQEGWYDSGFVVYFGGIIKRKTFPTQIFENFPLITK